MLAMLKTWTTALYPRPVPPSSACNDASPWAASHTAQSAVTCV